MKKVLLIGFIVALIFSFSVASAQKMPRVVTITCPGHGNPNIEQPAARIYIGETVTFSVVCDGVNGCTDGVAISGVPPIGNFNLTPTHKQETITFPTAGTYEYDVIKLKADKAGFTHGYVYVLSPVIPTMTQWGMIIMVVLIVGSTVFIMLRKRKASVPA